MSSSLRRRSRRARSAVFTLVACYLAAHLALVALLGPLGLCDPLFANRLNQLVLRGIAKG